MVDSNNNNSAVGKYSLRPRSESKTSAEDCCREDDVVTLLASEPKTRKTSRQRSQPLSKYRRRSANARERSRMREINEAFETLRRMVSWGSEHQGEKTTKISTLHLAMRYITALSEALRSPEAQTGDGLRIGEVVTKESLESRACARTPGCHRAECLKTPLLVQSVSRTPLSSHSLCAPISFSFMDKQNFSKRSTVTIKSSRVSEQTPFQKRTNPKCETHSSSTDGFLQEVSLLLSDGFVTEKVSSLPTTLDNCDSLQSTTETDGSSAISPACHFYSVKTHATSSVTDCCKTSDQLFCGTTLGFKSSVGKGSVVDTVQPEYDDNSFLPADEELGCLPMSHISLDEFNS